MREHACYNPIQPICFTVSVLRLRETIFNRKGMKESHHKIQAFFLCAPFGTASPVSASLRDQTLSRQLRKSRRSMIL
jgi:hypothetical protein